MDVGYAILYTTFFTSIAAIIMHLVGIVKKNETYFDSRKSAIIASALLENVVNKRKKYCETRYGI